MKTSIYSLLLLSIFFIAILLTACQKNEIEAVGAFSKTKSLSIGSFKQMSTAARIQALEELGLPIKQINLIDIEVENIHSGTKKLIKKYSYSYEPGIKVLLATDKESNMEMYLLGNSIGDTLDVKISLNEGDDANDIILSNKDFKFEVNQGDKRDLVSFDCDKKEIEFRFRQIGDINGTSNDYKNLVSVFNKSINNSGISPDLILDNLKVNSLGSISFVFSLPDGSYIKECL